VYKDSFGLEAYNCTAPLHFLGGNGLKSGPDIWGNPLYHQYSCVIINGVETCGGQDREDDPWGDGKQSDDKYNKDRCKKRRSNSCFEECLIDTWKNKPNPKYGLFGPGTNCQEYDDVNDDCFKKCLGKDKWTK
jgi:hypothetical protein